MPQLRSLLTPPAARTAAALLTVLATSVTLAACTSQGSGAAAKLDGEAGRVQTVIEKFSEYADDDKTAAICSELLTPQTRTQIAQGGDCKAEVQKIVDATDLTGLEVDAVKVTGTTAVATIVKTSRATDQTKIVLVQAAAKEPWKIAAFGNDAASGAAAGTTPASTTPGTSPSATPQS